MKKEWIEKQSPQFKHALSAIMQAYNNDLKTAVVRFDPEIEGKLIEIGYKIRTVKYAGKYHTFIDL